jgi:REP element-mobilizing transposase RayT
MRILTFFVSVVKPVIVDHVLTFFSFHAQLAACCILGTVRSTSYCLSDGVVRFIQNGFRQNRLFVATGFWENLLWQNLFRQNHPFLQPDSGRMDLGRKDFGRSLGRSLCAPTGFWQNGFWQNGFWQNGFWQNGFWQNGFRQNHCLLYMNSGRIDSGRITLLL